MGGRAIPVRGKTMASKRMAVRWAIVALVVGAVLIVLGAVEILESGPEAVYKSILTSPPWHALLGYRFDVLQLAAGITLSLAGTAVVSSSLTYLPLNRKREGDSRTIEMEKRTSDRKVSWATVALVVGIVLIALGVGITCSAPHQHYWLGTGSEGYYWVWDTNYILIGIALSIVGTAMASASETYRLVTKKKYGNRSGLGPGFRALPKTR